MRSASALALELNIAPILIGLILVALGTSLPELSFTINSFMNHKGELAFGNLIGSVIANSTLILGVTAIISPITSSYLPFVTSAAFMLFSCFLFATFVEGKTIFLNEGISLVGLYIIFIISQVAIPIL